MTGQNAVLDTAALERKAHVRTPIVERENATVAVDDEERTVRPPHDHPPPPLQLLKAAHPHKTGARKIIHGRSRLAIVRHSPRREDELFRPCRQAFSTQDEA